MLKPELLLRWGLHLQLVCSRQVFFRQILARLTITNKREITAIKRTFDRHVVIIFRCSYVNRNCVNNAYLKSLMFFAALELDDSSVKNLLAYRRDQKQNYFDWFANAD